MATGLRLAHLDQGTAQGAYIDGRIACLNYRIKTESMENQCMLQNGIGQVEKLCNIVMKAYMSVHVYNSRGNFTLINIFVKSIFSF